MSMAEAVQAIAVKKTNEKSFTDKILGKDDIEKIRHLMKKSPLSREDLLELLYLVSSSESKLYNFDERERYVLMKMFTWIRDFVTVNEYLYDLDAEKYKSFTPNGIKLLNNSKNVMEHLVKFIVDLYLNIARTSLSKNAVGFKEILNNKFEFSYDNRQYLSQEKAKSPTLLGSLGGRKP